VSQATRATDRLAFLTAAGIGDQPIQPLPADASFRRYFRVGGPSNGFILMDAPPEHEDVRPFMHVARLLGRLDYSAPAIIAEDTQRGFLLLEDLGDRTYTRVIGAGGDEWPLYGLAIDLLADLHRRFQPASELPYYTIEKLLAEATLLVDWFVAPPSAAIRAAYLAGWQAVLPAALQLPETLVLRDYHVDNLMLLDRPGLRACGLLDFQDAVIGPAAYDVVSLLEDARRDISDQLRQAMIERYLAAAPPVDVAQFEAAMAVLGAQRHAKVLGIFSRLAKRDGKPHYLKHLPRVQRLLWRSCRHPALAPVGAWLRRHLPEIVA
jgi:aminoglycoside/choline kinase family phosphotransferase